MKKLKTFSELNELTNAPFSEQELLEMANVTSEDTGIPNVVIWAGPNPSSHGKRIKVSNVPNRFDGHDCFVLTIPNFEVKGTIDTKFIDNATLGKIKGWVEKNMAVIEAYSDKKISTRAFLDGLKKV